MSEESTGRGGGCPFSRDGGGDGGGARIPPLAGEVPSEWKRGWEATYEIYAAALELYARGLLRRYGVPAVAGDEPQDLVQGFFSTMMGRNSLCAVSKIRDMDAFMHTAFWRYVRGRYRQSITQRRRPPGGVKELVISDLAIALDAEIEEPTAVHRAVARALATLYATRPLYAALIGEMIHANDGGRLRPEVPEQLGVTAKRRASTLYRARREFGRLLADALQALLGDTRYVRAICRRWLAGASPFPKSPTAAA